MHPQATSFTSPKGRQVGDAFFESFEPNNHGSVGHPEPGSGPGLQINAPLKVWSRALDVEGPEKHIEVNGGQLWMLGGKTGERQGKPTLNANSGAKVEVLGNMFNAGVLDDATITVADSDATIVGSAFRETDKSVTIQESVGGSTKTAAGADTSTFPSRALFDFDEPGKDPTGVVSQTGLHVPYYRSGTSKNWYYAARAA